VIGLDTNVLVRYVVQDDPQQSAAATAIIDELDADHPGFVSLVVLVELTWVLRRAYRVDDTATGEVIRTLLDAVEIIVHEPDAVRRALDRTPGGTDFSDALIAELGQNAGCTYTATFDKVAARLPYMELIST
jgi:predicted nucleic-acid-binding protein